MASPKVIDLDERLELGPTAAPEHVKPVRLAGVEVRVVCDINTIALSSMMGDTVSAADAIELIRSMIHAEDWPTLKRALNTHPAYRGEDGAAKLFETVNAILEVAAERPTKQPSDLQPGGSKRATSRTSAAGTSSRRGAASSRSR